MCVSLQGTMIASLTGPGFISLLTFFSTAASTFLLNSTTLSSAQSNSVCYVADFAGFRHTSFLSILFCLTVCCLAAV